MLKATTIVLISLYSSTLKEMTCTKAPETADHRDLHSQELKTDDTTDAERATNAHQREIKQIQNFGMLFPPDRVSFVSSIFL